MNRPAFYEALRKGDLFGGRLTAEQVTGMEGILDAFGAVGDGRAKTLAYCLATAYHETGRRMVPVREGFAATDAAARRAVAALAARRGPASAPARYGKPVQPHGHVYYGRGIVQLTWAENYKRSSADAGVDLFANPDKALDPEIGARLLVIGIIDGRWNGQGHGIARYLSDAGPDDLQGARRTVNITDKWQEIGRYYQGFLAAVRAGGSLPAPVVPAVDDGTLAAVRAVAEWMAACPGDPRRIGEWLARVPEGMR